MNFRQFFTSYSWWGKLIGCFLGFLMAGPAGALFGILVGNFFDRGLAQHLAEPFWFYHSEDRKPVQAIFFETCFSVMGHLAKADGRVSEREIQAAKRLMASMGLTEEQKKEAIEFFNAGKKPNFHLKESLARLQQACHDNRELLQLFVEIQYKAAKIDDMTAAKIQSLNVILSYLGFAPLHNQHRFYDDFDFQRSAYEQPKKRYSNQQSYSNQQHHEARTGIDQAYAILNVSRSASKQEVKSAYRRLMSRNHPDKLIAQGLPEEMIKLANEKTQKIAKAYEQICLSKGW